MSTSRRCAPRSGGRAQVCPSILIVFSTRSSAPIGRNRILSGSSPGRLVADAQACRACATISMGDCARPLPHEANFALIVPQCAGPPRLRNARRDSRPRSARPSPSTDRYGCAAVFVRRQARFERAVAMASNRRPAEVSRARSARPPNSSWWGSGARRQTSGACRPAQRAASVQRSPACRRSYGTSRHWPV